MKHNAPLNILPLLAAAAISAYRMVTVTSAGLNHAASGSAVIGVSGEARGRRRLLPARTSNDAWRGERGAGGCVARSPIR